MKKLFLKFLMKLNENEIAFDETTAAIFHESFNHPSFLSAPEEEQGAFRLSAARALYEIEVNQPLDAFFPGLDLGAYCQGAKMLDLGCYLGGKSIRWLEKYGGQEMVGLDVDPKYLAAAAQFAAERNAAASFSLGYAEKIPLPDTSLDVVVSANTFEHVRDIRASLNECRRVLRVGGYLIVLFPPFYYPKAHHLDLVTTTPCLHWFFSFETILQAYFEILEARGSRANWYRRPEEKPLPFEKGYSINGVSAGDFHSLVKDDWTIRYDGFRDSKTSTSRNPIKRALDRYGKIAALPFTRNLYEAVYLLEKPA